MRYTIESRRIGDGSWTTIESAQTQPYAEMICWRQDALLADAHEFRVFDRTTNTVVFELVAGATAA
jgi:hypothetical protein